MGLPWDAYYVLTKAEARLTNSKIHPNTGAPNYNITHLLSGLTIDQDLNMATFDITNATDISLLGNLNLPATTATEGNITVDGDTLIHFYNHSVFIGDNTGNYTTTAGGNVGIGNYALRDVTSGSPNLAIGVNALRKLTTGVENVAIGPNALYTTTGGNRNTALGSSALYANTTGYGNFGFGRDAMRSNQDGSHNVGIGEYALYNNVSGDANIGFGRWAGQYNQTGDNNVSIGYNAGKGPAFPTNKSGCVMIGFNAGMNEAGSNKLYIANTDTATPLIYGEFDNTILKFHAQVQVKQLNATLGSEALVIDQDDQDQAFVDYQGTSAGDTTKNISTLTAGNSIQGFIKVEVNGTAYWMPYYDAPTA